MTTTLIQEDLHHVLSHLPKDVIDLLKNNSQLAIAGGFIRATIAGERVNDIDIFGPSKEYLELIAKTFAIDRKARFHDTDNAFTVITPGRLPVQFIHRWTYEKQEDVLKDFDFSIAQAVIWYKPGLPGTWFNAISEYFYPDLASKRLRYLSPKRAEDAGGSLLRMRKFIARGYHIEALSLGKLVARLAMGVDYVRVAAEDRMSRDNEADAPTAEEYLSTMLTGLLREVDPMRVVDGVELSETSDEKLP